MIRQGPGEARSRTCLPRTRGDDPDLLEVRYTVEKFAPHARG